MSRFSPVTSAGTNTTNNTTIKHPTSTTEKPGLLRRIIEPFLRLLQFCSATTSLILFSIRIRKIISLYGQASKSNGAVEGILAAAVAYSIVAMLMKFCIKRVSSSLALKLMLLFIIFDILFVGAFIAVAVLTSPKTKGSSGPCTKSQRINNRIPGGINCALPWGTFALAIFSTLLHAATALFGMFKAKRAKAKTTRTHLNEKDKHHTQNLHGTSPTDTRTDYGPNNHTAAYSDDTSRGYRNDQYGTNQRGTTPGYVANQQGTNHLDTPGYKNTPNEPNSVYHTPVGTNSVDSQRGLNPNSNQHGMNNIDAQRGIHTSQQGTTGVDSSTYGHNPTGTTGTTTFDTQRAHIANQHSLDSGVGVQKEY